MAIFGIGKKNEKEKPLVMVNNIEKKYETDSAEEILEKLQESKSEDGTFEMINDFQNARLEKKLFDEIMMNAINSGASDIHFSLKENIVEVSFRMKGELVVIKKLSPANFFLLLNYAKDLFKMRVDDTRIHQDGSYGYLYETIDKKTGEKIKTVQRLRCLVMPGFKKYEELSFQGGLGKIVETMVIRLLAQDTISFELLGLKEYKKSIFSSINTEGIFLISGPTGSGKTTTLASIISELVKSNPGKKYYSIEDPVEIEIPGVTQLELTDSFKILNAMKGLLRGDPDFITVQEIRDASMVNFAVDLSNTGHTVFGTIHTKNTVSIKSRIKNVGGNIDLFMEVANLFHAQRLIAIPRKTISIDSFRKKMKETPDKYIKDKKLGSFYSSFLEKWDTIDFTNFILKNQLIRKNIIYEEFYGNKNENLNAFKEYVKAYIFGRKATSKVQEILPKNKKVLERIIKIIEKNLYIPDLFTPEEEKMIKKRENLPQEAETPLYISRYPIVEILNFKDVNIRRIMHEENPEEHILNGKNNFLTMFQDGFIKSILYGKEGLQDPNNISIALNIADFLKEAKQLYGTNPDF